MKKVIIIGSGVAGIASALRLKSIGYDVVVFENNNYPGGKLSSFKLGEYRFDAGPSLLTMPHYIDELFQLYDENPQDYFRYKKKDISCKYFWDDSIVLNAYSEKNKFIAQEPSSKFANGLKLTALLSRQPSTKAIQEPSSKQAKTL